MEETRLSNGIPVISLNFEGSVAATYWWNQVGSADEERGEEGFAHFLEHMHFKDAAAKDKGAASTGKLAREIESRGGDINAYTSFEQTVYHVTCAEAHWEEVVSEFGTLARPQKFLKSDFEREREVILEELKKNQDSPDRQMFEVLFNRTFPKHAYGRPVIGYEKILKSARVSALERFYRRTYVSDRMGIILVGPLGEEGSARRKSMLKVVEKRFGGGVIPASKRDRHETAQRKPLVAWARGKPAYFSKQFAVASPELTVSFTVPDIRHPDVPALDVAAGILGMGEMGRLYQKLFYEKKSVTSVAGGLYVPRDPGMIYFRAEVPTLEGVAEAGRQIFEEIARLGREGPTQAELERVIVHAESEKLYATQTADGMAGRIGYLRFILGNLMFDQAYVEALKAVDAKQIQKVCAEYFNTTRLTGLMMTPKSKSADLAVLEKDAVRILGKPTTGTEKKAVSGKKVFKSTQSESEKPGAVVWTRPSGIRVVHAYRPQSQVISAQAAVLGGLRLELARGETLWGASNLLSQSWSKGTRHRDTNAILAEVEWRAASLDGFSGRNTIGLQATFLNRDWKRLSELFGEVLGEPVFPETEVANSRRVTEEAIRGIEDHTSQLCSKLFLETLFERHPYGKMTYGNLESLARIGRTELARLHAEWVNPKRLVLSVSGAVTREQVDEWIGQSIEPRLAQPPVMGEN
ncbi:MAG: insulinase family protein, partial [Bdellovibrionota bacterium]